MGFGISMPKLYLKSWNLNVINPSSPKGICNNPETVFAPMLKNAQPRSKIAKGTYKFILSPQFSEKKSNLPPSPGVG